MLIHKQMRGSRRLLAGALALGLGAGQAAAQMSVGEPGGAGETKAAPSWEALIYQASGGFAAVQDRLTIRPDGRLMASREFLGQEQRVRAFVQPEEAAGLERAFRRWIERPQLDGGKSEMFYEVTLRRGSERLTSGAGRQDPFLARLSELHRKALAGELAEAGDVELALPLPDGSMAGATLHETRLIAWHLDQEGQRIEDARRDLSRLERDRLKSVLEREGDTIVVPVEADPDALRVFEVRHAPRQEEHSGSVREEEEEEEIQVRITPVEDGLESLRLAAVLRMIRG